LAVKHINSNGEAAAYYAVPGGGVDPHESLEDGLRRELREELGVEATVGKLLCIQQFNSERAGYEEELEFFFAVTNVDDFEKLDISATSHGAIELAVCKYVDPRTVTIYPRFLQTVDLEAMYASPATALIVDNLDELKN
jgi:ADP-ribose pyrophosphatase YjhB (NUDIX family)